MTTLLSEFEHWLKSNENEQLEFKTAESRFEFDQLLKYSVAIANEGGGRIILGVTDSKPRRVIGTKAFDSIERTKNGLFEKLHFRVDCEEYFYHGARTLIFTVPSRPIGMPISLDGTYWMRAGESLVPMSADQIKRIFDESVPDYSASICPQATLADLDTRAIKIFQQTWVKKSGNPVIKNLSFDQLLTDAELVMGSGITYAALILLGTRQALGKHLAQAEVVFEYRSNEASLPFQQRKEYREGFFLFFEDLWNNINLRNEVQHYQDGLFVWDIPTFNEVVVREAILNAVSHRDYRLAGSIFLRQFPQKIEISSPGGFPVGITLENLLWRQSPRNRRIAEVLAKVGLVERSGQGTRRMFEECIKESKPIPDFKGTDPYQVEVTLKGKIQDPQFLKFLERVTQEAQVSFTVQDLLVLDLVHRGERVPQNLKDRLIFLNEVGIIETTGRGRGVFSILSRRLYHFIGKKGVYTRKRGLDRETNKALLMRHVSENAKEGSRLQELRQVLPALSRNQVQSLLRDLKKEKKIRNEGLTNAGKWYPAHQE